MNTQATTLLADLTRLGIQLEPQGDRLAYYPRSKMTTDLLSRMRACKAELLQLFRSQAAIVNDDSSEPVDTKPVPVSVIILAQKNVQYLETSVLSAIGQTQPPCEVLVVDSTGTVDDDGLLKLANVRLLRAAAHEVLQAGFQASSGQYVVFLHADNLLSRDYLQQALARFDEPYVGAVYSDHELFGDASGRTAYPDRVTQADLARSDIGHFAAIIRRDALSNLNALDAPTLLPQLARLGWGLRKQPSTLLVRATDCAAMQSYFHRQSLTRQHVTLFIPLSGRNHTWDQLSQFLQRQTWSHDQIHLVLCDTSQDQSFSQQVKHWIAACDYTDVRHFTYSPAQAGLADQPRRASLAAVNLAMCRIYNRLRSMLETDYCWILEDDIVPPDDVLQRLLHHFEEHVASVSAPYRSRFDGRFLVWDRERPATAGVHRIDRPNKDSPQVQDIRGSGFGCLVVRTECLKRHVFSLPPGEQWYDPYFFKALGDHWRRRVDWTCECRHLHNTPRPGAEITRRNLIYHITPFASSDIWLRNVRQILKRMQLFNGRRIVAIATGDGLVSPLTVERAFDGHDVEFILRPNSRRLRENATFLELLESIRSADPSDATFYAHAKGVATVGDVRGVTYWRNAMYHELLDDWPKIAELLSSYAVVGTHRRRHDDNPNMFPDNSQATWHFSGTFFWLRNQDVFATQRWRDEWQATGWGAEAWPGSMFPLDRSACVAFDGLTNPYDPKSYPNPIPDEQENDMSETNDDSVCMTDTLDESSESKPAALKIELGGGDKPRGDDYINLDKRNLSTVDHVCDFETDDLPFGDDTVRAVYSSHCFEHFAYGRVLREMVRVCEIGAYVEIRVPHWLSENALCQGHRHTFSPEEVERISQTATRHYFTGCTKRLKHSSTELVPSRYFPEAKQLFPHMSDDQVLRYVPNACYEIKYTFHVVENS